MGKREDVPASEADEIEAIDDAIPTAVAVSGVPADTKAETPSIDPSPIRNTLEPRFTEARPAAATVEPAESDAIATPTPSAPPAMPRAAQLSAKSDVVIKISPADAAQADLGASGASPAPVAVRAKGQTGRFALLAASVAIAASIGAVAGSLGIAGYDRAFPTSVPAPVAAPREQASDEVKTLKETVAQLRATTKSLGDSLATLRTSITNSGTAATAQLAKITESLERVERGQTDRRAALTLPAPHLAVQTVPETTGSVLPRPSYNTAAVEPNPALKPSIVSGWVLRKVYDGAALIEGREGIIEIEPGTLLPGVGRIEGIKRQEGRWVVVTSRGLIVGR